jgi:hypothetical protein
MIDLRGGATARIWQAGQRATDASSGNSQPDLHPWHLTRIASHSPRVEGASEWYALAAERGNQRRVGARETSSVARAWFEE